MDVLARLHEGSPTPLPRLSRPPSFLQIDVGIVGCVGGRCPPAVEFVVGVAVVVDCPLHDATAAATTAAYSEEFVVVAVEASPFAEGFPRVGSPRQVFDGGA